MAFRVRIHLGGQEDLGVLDTGATISIVAEKYFHAVRKNTIPTAAIRMADDHVVHSCGDCEVDVDILGGSSCMVKMSPRLPDGGTREK